MAILENDIQKLYIAYFGRPADPAGLDHYAARPDDTVAIAREFSAFPESQALYGEKSPTELVSAIYHAVDCRL